jgi:hypothetical protein
MRETLSTLHSKIIPNLTQLIIYECNGSSILKHSKGLEDEFIVVNGLRLHNKSILSYQTLSLDDYIILQYLLSRILQLYIKSDGFSHRGLQFLYLLTL